MLAKGDDHAPKGLIFEAYRIEGISKSECRTIFLDWALSLPDTVRPVPAIDVLLTRYGVAHSDHPMTAVLTEGRAQVARPKRRGGWRSRSRPQ